MFEKLYLLSVCGAPSDYCAEVLVVKMIIATLGHTTGQTNKTYRLETKKDIGAPIQIQLTRNKVQHFFCFVLR